MRKSPDEGLESRKTCVLSLTILLNDDSTNQGKTKIVLTRFFNLTTGCCKVKVLLFLSHMIRRVRRLSCPEMIESKPGGKFFVGKMVRRIERVVSREVLRLRTSESKAPRKIRKSESK